MPAPGDAARSRSMPAIADDASPRMSTITTSGGVPSRGTRSSITLTGTGPGAQQAPDLFPEFFFVADDEAD